MAPPSCRVACRMRMAKQAQSATAILLPIKNAPIIRNSSFWRSFCPRPGVCGCVAEKLIAAIGVIDIDDLLPDAIGAAIDNVPLPVVSPVAAAGKGRGHPAHVAAGGGARELERNLSNPAPNFNVFNGAMQIAGEGVEGVDASSSIGAASRPAGSTRIMSMLSRGSGRSTPGSDSNRAGTSAAMRCSSRRCSRAFWKRAGRRTRWASAWP